MKKAVTIVLLAAVALAALLGFSAFSDINGKSSPGETVSVIIPAGSGANAVGEILSDRGVVKNSLYFKLYTKLNPPQNLQYGTFQIGKDMSYREVIRILSTVQERRATVTVTFPEGFSLIQFARRMENNGLCAAREFIDTANNGDFSQFEFWNKIKDHEFKFMKGEGYLYPDTYEFYRDDTVYNMVEKLYANFDSKITDEMYRRMDELGMSLDEVVTLASFVQEEAGHPEDMPYVAACLCNRLLPGSPYPKLQCNVCSYVKEEGNYVYDYIIPYYGGENNVPSGMLDAYDTYEIYGLPPGPISNPGIDAIKNTLWPRKDFEDYYFFVTDLSGKYYYGKNEAEHNANINKAMAVNAKMK